MAVQVKGAGSGTPLVEVGPGEQPELVRRADHLCRGAEPHADTSPCPAHLHEAHRQLFGMALAE